MVKTQWMLHAKKADFNEIARKFGISPVTARIIRNRDVTGEDEIKKYLFGTLKDLYSPNLLPDMKKAVEIICRKIEEKKPVRIVGDYDIDGVCATYLLYQGLRRAGACVDYEIPDRIKDGYGINESIIRSAWEGGIDTILTCDNGIAAVSQIKLAKELGMTVIVTDHHDIMEEGGKDILPEADAIVNPKRRDSIYPYSGICGGLVAYKLVQALFEELGIPDREWKELLEFAAIATVGDVMLLQDENRIVVKEGLKAVSRTRNIGLSKLIEKNDLDADSLTAYHIGFIIGPCINAGGRLESAKIALRLFLAESEAEADQLAMELKTLNDVRKDMTRQGEEEAAALVEEFYMEDKVLVVFLQECHESLAGIIAGRLRERYQKPAFVLTRAEGGVKGSGRSIEAYHMFQELVKVKELLCKFGGHPMAAGLSLEEKNVDEFRRQLNENAELTEEDFIRKIWIDVPMPLEYVSEAMIQELEMLEPFGQGNEKPQFAQKNLKIRSARVIGRNRNAVKLSVATPQGKNMDAMVFGDGDGFMEEMGGSREMDAIYYPSVNIYNGNKTLQIIIKNYRFL